MSTDLELLLALAILFVSTFTRSALGFGDALVAMPLLTLLLGIRVATPLVAFAASTIAVAILSRNWRSADLRGAWRLIAAALAGIPVGLLFLKQAPETTVRAILGAVLILFAGYRLLNPALPRLARDWPALPFGFLAGILGGAYNTNGPPAVVYGTLRGWPPATFRATLQCFFLPTGLMILAGHGVAGLWTPTVLRIYLYALPVILLAILLGGRANRAIGHQRFQRAVYGALIVMGILLFV
jgi:uncharacterized membrane protein YfcA